jgi:hypothetical protein
VRTKSYGSICSILLALTAASSLAGPSQPNPAASVRVPRFEADTSKVPDLQPWGKAAEALCAVWYPKVVKILESDDTQRPLPEVVRIVFDPDYKGVAAAGGGRITISPAWVRSHPHDFGMVVHELTHLVQRYPRSRAGWLVEGIADYVRLQHFEPDLPRPKIDFTRAKHTDAYKTTAAFLIWLERKYGPAVVPRLNAALRAGTYTDTLFADITGKGVQTLWTDFAAS